MTSSTERWRSVVDACDYVGSMLYTSAARSVQPPEYCSCNICVAPAPCFSSPKALASHMRIKHRMRSRVKRDIDDSGVCQISKTMFVTRIRVIAYLSDVRRPKCRSHMLRSELPLAPLHKCTRLKTRDKDKRRNAIRQGHTHPIASGSARTVVGKRIGHTTR